MPGTSDVSSARGVGISSKPFAVKAFAFGLMADGAIGRAPPGWKEGWEMRPTCRAGPLGVIQRAQRGGHVAGARAASSQGRHDNTVRQRERSYFDGVKRSLVVSAGRSCMRQLETARRCSACDGLLWLEGPCFKGCENKCEDRAAGDSSVAKANGGKSRRWRTVCAKAQEHRLCRGRERDDRVPLGREST
jgi:hypothetical protein